MRLSLESFLEFLLQRCNFLVDVLFFFGLLEDVGDSELRTHLFHVVFEFFFELKISLSQVFFEHLDSGCQNLIFFGKVLRGVSGVLFLRLCVLKAELQRVNLLLQFCNLLR